MGTGMRIERKGLLRLWIVLSVIWTAGAAMWATSDLIKTWATLNQATFSLCNSEFGHKASETVSQCAARQGANLSAFEHEGISAGQWWAQALGYAFLIDIVVTALLVGVFYVCRWVWRGFRPTKESIG